jgi:hypothetical protein
MHSVEWRLSGLPVRVSLAVPGERCLGLASTASVLVKPSEENPIFDPLTELLKARREFGPDVDHEHLS